MPVSPPQPSARPGHNTQQQTGSSLCREHDPLDPYSASASSMPSSGLQRKVTCCMYTACASAASDEGLQHSDVNKGLDMHTVTVWAATCNEHRARSPPRAAGTPADTTCKAEHKHLLLHGKVWQTSCSSGCKAAPPGPAGRADLLQGGRPGWQAAHLRHKGAGAGSGRRLTETGAGAVGGGSEHEGGSRGNASTIGKGASARSAEGRASASTIG